MKQQLNFSVAFFDSQTAKIRIFSASEKKEEKYVPWHAEIVLFQVGVWKQYFLLTYKICR